MPKPEHLGYAILALALSLAAHLLLLGGLARLPGPAWGSPPRPAAPDRDRRGPIRIQMFEVRNRVFQRDPAATAALGERPPELVRKLLEELRLTPAPAAAAALTGLGANVIAKPKPAEPTPALTLAPPVAIVEIDRAALAPGRLSPERPLAPQLPREELLGALAPGYTGADRGTGGTAPVGLGMRLGDLPGTPLRPEELAALAEPPADLNLGPRTGMLTAPGAAARMDGFVSVRLTVHEEVGGGGYFRIDLAPNPAKADLGTVPKDLLFLLDCSASIGQSKLAYFKSGLDHVVQLLNPSDRFNIVAFRNRSTAAFPGLTAADSEDTIRKGRMFVKEQSVGGLTDIYRTLEPWMADAGGAQATRPLNVFLISDGNSTVQDKLESDELIRRVVRLRRPRVSVYSFSAGGEANLFLMDLLAYSNRGLSLYVQEPRHFARDLAEFIRTHSDIIVANLRWEATGGLGAEMFPKALPHLYREEVLSVYGRFPAGASQIGLQIIGRDATGREQELVYSGDLRSAPRTGPELGRVWASQKLYHLLAERVLQPDRAAAVDAEIKALAARYRLRVPYL